MRIACLCCLLIACSDDPSANLAFVTSTTIVPRMIGSLDNADATCAAAAKEAKLSGTFRAWLSTSTQPASERITGANGWVRTDRKPFADQRTDLLAGKIAYPLRLDEHGVDLAHGGTQERIVTGTTSGGAVAANCNDFTAAGPLVFGVVDGTTDQWTQSEAQPFCDMPMHLACLGVDIDGAAPISPASGRRAFITRGRHSLTGGVAEADMLCTTEAGSGEFRALLATTTAAAFSRLSPGKPWVRPDGVIVATDTSDLIAPINVTLDGEYVDDWVWIGSKSLGAVADPGATCDEWTNAQPSAMGTIAKSARSDADVLSWATDRPCNQAVRLYCLER